MIKNLNVAVFASGNGSNFQALIDKKEEGLLHVNLSVLIGDNNEAKAFDRAQEHKIPIWLLDPNDYDSEGEYIYDIFMELKKYNIDLIVLAGYLKKIPARVIFRYRHQIINIHPALLPAFGGEGMYGKHVHQAVIDSGAKVSGITVHYVNEEYDCGNIIFQEATKVLSFDTVNTLAARVLKLEHKYYWRIIESIVIDINIIRSKNEK